MPRAPAISQHPVIVATSDATLTGALLSSPAWAPALADINLLLTTATLIIGLVLGMLRLLGMYRDAKRKRREGPPA
jgi:hypothetical protein